MNKNRLQSRLEISKFSTDKILYDHELFNNCLYIIYIYVYYGTIVLFMNIVRLIQQ